MTDLDGADEITGAELNPHAGTVISGENPTDSISGLSSESEFNSGRSLDLGDISNTAVNINSGEKLISDPNTDPVDALNPETEDIEDHIMIYVIINLDFGSKVLKYARHFGINGGTITLGRGTARGALLRFLGLDEIRREIVLMVAEKRHGLDVMDKLEEKFKFHKPGHGIAFAIPVCETAGASGLKSSEICGSREVKNSMNKLITVIVDKGKVETAMDAALEAGSRGGTIINARGSGADEAEKIFAMEIEPEKEVLFILSQTSETDKIVKSIYDALDMSIPGNGLIYVQNVIEAYGLNMGN